MRADYILGPHGKCGDLVQIQGGRVAGENRALFAHGVELFEDRLLDAEIFKHRLNHQIHAAHIIVRECGL